jgi:hypothetical protein
MGGNRIRENEYAKTTAYTDTPAPAPPLILGVVNS